MDLTRKLKGEIGELKAISYLHSLGYEVYRPMFDNASVDLLVMDGMGSVFRISVKYTSSQARRGGGYIVNLQNSSRRKDNTMKVKNFDPTSCDSILVYVAPLDKIVAVKASAVVGKTQLTVH